MVARPLERSALETWARGVGFHALGIATTAGLDAALPAALRPSALHAGMRSAVVVVRGGLRGLAWARHVPTKHFWAGRILKEVDDALGDLAAAIEREGHAALPVLAMALDYDARNPTDLTPTGQGTFLARVAAVQAGLGTLGLNEMLLTPRWGPRCFVGAVLTEAALPPGVPLVEELCPGLEACGRCAAICPERAIPLRQPAGAPLAAVRALDCVACARSSQPYGPATMAQHLTDALASTSPAETWRLAKDLTTGELWQQVTMHKEGAFTACHECAQVCPVGDDYAAIQRSPHRQEDLPEGVEHRHEEGWVTVEWVGPQWRWPTPPPERAETPPLRWMERRR